MRKILCTIITIAMVIPMILGFNVNAAQSNLITNGSFSEYKTDGEPTSGPKGWNYSKAPTATTDITGWSDVFVTGGNNYITLPYGDWMASSTYAEALVGEEYEIGFKYLSVTEERARVQVSFHTYDEATETYSGEISGQTLTKSFSSTNGSWQRSSFRVIVPEGASHLKVILRSNIYVGAAAGSETLYYDDVTVNKAADVPFYNSDMEIVENNMPVGFFANEGTVGTDYLSSSNAYIGVNSLQINGNGSSVTVYKNIPVTKDLNYIISGYVKTDATTSIAIKVSKDNISSSASNTKTMTTTGGSWQKVTLPSVTAGFGGIALSFTVTGEGTVYFDSFSIIEDKNLIANSSFETVTLSGTTVSAVPSWGPVGAGITIADVISSDGGAYDGNYYLKLKGGTPDLAGKGVQTNKINFTAGKSYKVSVWYKSTRTAGGRLYIENGTSSAAIDFGNFISDGWIQYNMIFTPTTVAATPRIRLYNTTA